MIKGKIKPSSPTQRGSIVIEMWPRVCLVSVQLLALLTIVASRETVSGGVDLEVDVDRWFFSLQNVP